MLWSDESLMRGSPGHSLVSGHSLLGALVSVRAWGQFGKILLRLLPRGRKILVRYLYTENFIKIGIYVKPEGKTKTNVNASVQSQN